MKKSKKVIKQIPTVSNCQFYGVKWDATSVAVVQTIADGLVENAKGLNKLAEVLKSQNVVVNGLLTIGVNNEE